MPSAWKGGRRVKSGPKTAREYMITIASRKLLKAARKATIKRIKRTPGYAIYSEQLKEARRLQKIYFPKKEPPLKGTHRA